MPNQLAQESSITSSSSPNAQSSNKLETGDSVPVNKMLVPRSLRFLSPHKTSNSCINIITDTTREPMNLHGIARDRRQNRFGQN